MDSESEISDMLDRLSDTDTDVDGYSSDSDSDADTIIDLEHQYGYQYGLLNEDEDLFETDDERRERCRDAREMQWEFFMMDARSAGRWCASVGVVFVLRLALVLIALKLVASAIAHLSPVIRTELHKHHIYTFSDLQHLPTPWHREPAISLSLPDISSYLLAQRELGDLLAGQGEGLGVVVERLGEMEESLRGRASSLFAQRLLRSRVRELRKALVAVRRLLGEIEDVREGTLRIEIEEYLAGKMEDVIEAGRMLETVG